MSRLRTATRRAAAAVSGLAALVLVAAACGESGTAEEAVGSATSAVGSAANQATSAVGSATDGGTSAPEGTGTEQTPAEGEGESGGDPDQEFLRDIRNVGVDVADEQDYLERGRAACGSLDGGKGFGDVLGEYNAAHAEAPVTEGPVVIGAAIKAFCSQHLPLVEQNDAGGEQQN